MGTEGTRKPRTVIAIATLAVVVLLLLILFVSGARWVSSSAAAAPPEVFSIFFTCDTRGHIEPCGCASGMAGGISRRQTYLAREGRGRGKIDTAIRAGDLSDQIRRTGRRASDSDTAAAGVRLQIARRNLRSLDASIGTRKSTVSATDSTISTLPLPERSLMESPSSWRPRTGPYELVASHLPKVASETVTRPLPLLSVRSPSENRSHLTEP